jgi:quinol monooxygenase YgiN
MFLVVSEWKAKPGKEAEFERAGKQAATRLRKQPGVLLLEIFRSGDRHVSVHGYQDEATYRKLIDDPQGAFARSQEELGIEKVGEWIGSQRGETLTF